MNEINGSRKAHDLPDPVGAKPIISRIFIPIGNAYIWIAVGVL